MSERIRLSRAAPWPLALLLVGVLSAPANAAWTPPQTLSAALQDATVPQVAVDADGDGVFTWQRWDGTNFRVQARARSAAGVLSPVQTLSPAGRDGIEPQVAVDDDGDAVFIWRQYDGSKYQIRARARSAAGVLSPVQTLTPAGQNAEFPQVAVDADGDAVVTWTSFDGTNTRIQARARSSAGVLSAVQTLSAAGQNAQFSQVAVDADGDAVVTWTRWDGTNSRIQARARSAAGVLSTGRTLSAAGASASEPQVAVDDDGDAVFTWTRWDLANPSLPYQRIQARARSAAGVLSTVRNLSAAGREAVLPQVAIDADGDAVFTWRRFDGSYRRVQTRARSAGGVLSAVQTLSAAGASTFQPQVAVDDDGDATFTWMRSDGIYNRIQARLRSAGGVLSTIQTLSPAGQDAERDPQVAVDADGDAVVTWRLWDGKNWRIQAASGP